MGVSGSGKTTIGKALANQLGIPFYDGDDFHSKANIEKMSAGISLNDIDRQPWLENINDYAVKSKTDLVIACSALKIIYRKTLSKNIKSYFLFLNGNFDLINKRFKNRKGHFMSPSLLQSQFDTLELCEECISINVNQSVEKICEDILQKIMKLE